MHSQMRLVLLLRQSIPWNQETTERPRVRIWPPETWLFWEEVVFPVGTEQALQHQKQPEQVRDFY